MPDLALEQPVPPVVADNDALRTAVAALALGNGPVGVDAERAGSYRYSQGAYLVQVFRADAPALMLDPTGVDDFSDLVTFLDAHEWVMQAAHNDLDCMAGLGLVPTRMFDTEIAAQLLGDERVGLAALVEGELGRRMRKGHGQADWSRRPLPDSWLEYAVFDVQVLPELRHRLAARLEQAGKSAWAEQEFAHQIRDRPMIDPADRWRRTAGAGGLRTDTQRGVLKALWELRDQLAVQRDVAWHRIAKDAQLVSLAKRPPKTVEQLGSVPGLPKPVTTRPEQWLAAVRRGVADPQPRPALVDGPPGRSPRAWEQHDPAAAARLVWLRAAVRARAEQLSVWPQTLLGADVVADVAWVPPADAAARMAELAARPWQVEQTVDLVEASADPPAPVEAPV